MCRGPTGEARVRGALRPEGMRKSTMATGMGTEGYASPEQLRSAADVDRRADIFSAGVTLFELALAEALKDGLARLPQRPFSNAMETSGPTDAPVD